LQGDCEVFRKFQGFAQNFAFKHGQEGVADFLKDYKKKP